MRPSLKLSMLAGISAALVACTEAADPIGAPDPFGALDHSKALVAVLDVTALDLGELSGSSRAVGINDAGQITGWSDPGDGDTHGFLYDGGVVTEIGAAGWTNVVPAAINERGWVVGNAKRPDGSRTGFIWDGTLTDLGALIGNDVAAQDINDGPSPAVVGIMWVEKTIHPFRWSAQAGAEDLAGRIGGECTIPFAINDVGDIVGSRDGSAFLLTADGALSVLPNLPGGTWAVAVNISEAGVIVGEAGDHAVKWENGTVIDLGTLGFNSSVAYAVNDGGQVAGTANDAVLASCEPTEVVRPELTVPFVWDDGNLTDLGGNSKGLAYAFDINDAQGVVGTLGDVAVSWTIAIEPTTPEEGTERIVEGVVALIDAEAVGSGTGNALLAKLDAITRQLNQGNGGSAARLLQSFIQQVEGWIVSGQIAQDDGDDLIQLATEALALIE
jgi:probable HAF family extracellular repeat protein